MSAASIKQKNSISFPEFLISSGKISEADMIECLVMQQSQQRSILDIIRELKLMTNHEIFQIVNLQNQTEKDFRSCARSIGKWIEDWNDQIQKEISKSQPSIIQLLLETKKIQPETMNQLLDEFLSIDQNIQLSQTAPIQVPRIDVSRIRNLANAVKSNGQLSIEQIVELLDSFEALIEDIGALELRSPAELHKLLSQIRFHRKAGLKPRPERLKEWLMMILDTSQRFPNLFF